MLMAGELPEDLVTQILVCLPVVSLLRFKSVCKSWYALITQQNFITKHLLHNNNNNSNTFLFKIRDTTTEDHFVSTLSYETHQVSLTQPVPLPFFGIQRCVITVEGSCNGLVCLRYSAYEFDVVIWNPATKETKVVPQSNLPGVAPAGYRPNCDGIGFGFDAKTNDYKIINFRSISDPDTPFDLFENEVVIYQTEVYSLSSDSWTKVDGPPCSVRSNGSKIYINGMASWKAFDDDWESFVLSFDMSDEVFLQTPLPDEVTRELSASWNLFVLNESIAMAVSIWNRNRNFSYESSFHIWSLLEVGVKNSWTKLLTIEPVEIPRFRRSLGLWNNEIMLFEKYEHQLAVYDLSPKEFTDLQIVNGVIPSSRSQLALYDLSTKEITDLQIGNGVTPSSQSQLVTYMESLVSLKSRTILEGPSFYI